jgi:hypothetical protein
LAVGNLQRLPIETPSALDLHRGAQVDDGGKAQPADRLEPVGPETGQLAGTVDGTAPDLAATRSRQATQIAEIERAPSKRNSRGSTSIAGSIKDRR